MPTEIIQKKPRENKVKIRVTMICRFIDEEGSVEQSHPVYSKVDHTVPLL